MIPFKTIRKRAEARKGGTKALAQLLPDVPDRRALTHVPDDRALAEMTRRIFCSGFVWRVIGQKWPGFEIAFQGFDVHRLCFEPDEYWETLAGDETIVRHPQKIMAVRHNAHFVADIANKHGSFGHFLANWPPDDQMGLLALLSKRGKRLGGMTGQYFLRYIGWDGFVLSRDVVACLRDAGAGIAEMPTSKRDLVKAQQMMLAWARESGLPMTHVSRIAAMSIGENTPFDRLDNGESKGEGE
ncbi:MAG: DNA-3-methyladenine glycosylase I [Hyphomicrobiaceae bacterium]